MIPLPAQPTPGSGPPASTHRIPLYPVKTMSDRESAASPLVRTRSITVGMNFPCISILVLSRLGSQPIWRIESPLAESAAERLADVVDFPMPPLPYRAICFITVPMDRQFILDLLMLTKVNLCWIGQSRCAGTRGLYHSGGPAPSPEGRTRSEVFWEDRSNHVIQWTRRRQCSSSLPAAASLSG